MPRIARDLRSDAKKIQVWLPKDMLRFLDILSDKSCTTRQEVFKFMALWLEWTVREIADGKHIGSFSDEEINRELVWPFTKLVAQAVIEELDKKEDDGQYSSEECS